MQERPELPPQYVTSHTHLILRSVIPPEGYTFMGGSLPNLPLLTQVIYELEFVIRDTVWIRVVGFHMIAAW
jgi:hypothetical protein